LVSAGGVGCFMTGGTVARGGTSDGVQAMSQ
jgi:hypothetical protein